MSIYISNTAYLLPDDVAHNHPIICWQSVLGVSDIIADTELETRPAINLWNPDTASVWEAADATDQYITLNNVSAAAIDCIGIAKHNFGTAGVQVQIQSSPDGSTWSDVTVVRTPTDNSSIVFYFTASSAAYFRIKLMPIAVAPVIAHIKMGAALVLQRKISVGHSPATLVKHASVITNGSENGQFLGKIVTREWHQTDIKQENNLPDFVRSRIVPFIAHAHTGTFFFAWRPIDYPAEVVYGWTDDSITPTNQRSNGMMEFGFKMQAVA